MIYICLILAGLVGWLAFLLRRPKRDDLLETIHKLEEGLRHIENDRKTDYGAIREQMRSLMITEQQLRHETASLVKALRSPIARGRWGEVQLRRVVELAGMLSHCDFSEQTQETFEEARLRPDLIVHLPGGRQVIIDAKVPLESFLDAVETSDEDLKQEKLLDHARLVRNHATQLSRKSYWDHFQPTPEFVVLFLPSETFFSAALESDPSLIETSAAQNVILATPTTLIALLRAVAYGWRQETLSIHAEEVQKLGKELYKRLMDLEAHWSKLGRSLESSVESYNKATGTLESRVLVSARKFQELGAASTSQELPSPDLIEKEPRLLNKSE